MEVSGGGAGRSLLLVVAGFALACLPASSGPDRPCCEQVQVMFEAWDSLCDEIDPERTGPCAADSLFERIR